MFGVTLRPTANTDTGSEFLKPMFCVGRDDVKSRRLRPPSQFATSINTEPMSHQLPQTRRPRCIGAIFGGKGANREYKAHDTLEASSLLDLRPHDSAHGAMRHIPRQRMTQ